MSAETLRRAASLMRERAGAATEGSWRPVQGSSGNWWVEAPYSATIADLDVDYSTPDADAAHIAAWHPAVALAVADWLDREADEHEHYVSQAIRNNTIRLAYANDRANHALAVARAYLGESA